MANNDTGITLMPTTLENQVPSGATRPHVLAAWSSMFGTSIEWFDFFLYGTAAALVFNKIFFPQLDPLTGTLAAFATYAVGFVGRPMGGIIFAMPSMAFHPDEVTGGPLLYLLLGDLAGATLVCN